MTVDTVHGGRYELVTKLGTGGFGSVWRARDTTLLRDVAVKLIEIDVSSGEAGSRAVERFRREAQAIAGLAHPNVVTAYDFGVDDGRAYLVMELIEIDVSSGEAGSRAVERFRREAQAIAGLAHPNVVTPYDFGVDRGPADLGMEV